MNLLLQSSLHRTKVPAMILICLFVLQHTSFATSSANLLTANKSLNARVNVTGKVTDSKGEPLPGVTVKIKGSNSGTSTDINGVFRMNLPAGNVVLVFTYIGFQTKEVPASAKMEVQLSESTNSLEEVVVVGYGTQKKAHLTGSVVDIKADQIADLPVTNIGAALSGRLQGVGVSGGNSRPGSKATITIRNQVPGGGGSPLYVIDGVIQIDGQNAPDATLFNNLDPSEVENISILKDAAAAVYGVRGANGVILVTTKKGKSGKPKISYNGSVALNDEAFRTKMMSAYEFGQYMNAMNGPYGDNKTPQNSSNNYRNFNFSPDELEAFKSINHDWLDGAWKASYNSRHTLSLSGGAEKATYFASVGYNKQDGNLGTLDYNRWNFRAGTDVEVASNLKIGLQVSGNNDELVKTFNKVSGEGAEDDYRNLLLTPRYVPMYINGLPVKIPGTNNDLSRYHFYEIQRLGNLAETDSRFFTVNISAEYKVPFVEGLRARASYARNTSGSHGSQIGTKYVVNEFVGLGENRHLYEGATEYTPRTVSNGNRLYYSNMNQSNTQMNFVLNYEKQIGKHNISGLFSVEKGESGNTQEDVWKDDPIQATNGQFSTAFGEYSGRSSRNESGTLGYIGRVNYRYAEKYLFEFLFRTDASTKFAPENYWGKFYSGSLGWVISEEDFFKVDAVDFLKLRYSAGILGNDLFQTWAWKQRYTLEEGKGVVYGGNGNNATGIKMGLSPNRDAHWTTEFKNNLGIDARFLKNRLSATIEGYYNYGSDLLVTRVGSVPVTVGGSVASENYGKGNAFGYEIELGWNSQIGKDFNYGINARLNWGDTKVVRRDFNDIDVLYPWRAQPGKSDDIGMWGYDYLGMFRSQEEIDAYYNEYKVTSVFGTKINSPADLKPGMLYYRDVRGPLQSDGTFAGPDGVIDENDQIKLKNRKDNHYGFGMTLKAGYKGFSFDCVLAGSFGGWSEISERNKLNNDISRVFTNLPEIWGDVFDPVNNPSGSMPNPHWENMYNKPSTFWEVSSFRMRIASINMGYSIPKSISDRLKVSNARVYLSGINPINLYNPYGYRDPNVAWNSYPALRTYSFGLNLTL